MTTVAIILVNWKGSADTLECLTSVLQLSGDFRIHAIVVDNASPDDSVVRIEQWLAGKGTVEIREAGAGPHWRAIVRAVTCEVSPNRYVSLVVGRSNNGFAAGNNIGIQFADQLTTVDYYWILNNDTTVHVDAVRHLCARMEANSSLGICGSTLVHVQPAGRVQAYGGVHYSYVTGRGFHIGAGESIGAPPPNNVIEPQLTYVSGASMFVRRAFVERVGLMSERYFLYNEELDWCWRGRGLFELGVATAAIVYHKEGMSIGTETQARPASILSDFYQCRNKLMFAASFTPVCYPTVWIFIAARALKRLRQGHFANAKVIARVLLGCRSFKYYWTS
ncbi:glycosyltransferase family 2 protein [Aquincola sp. MAHUQ-54]|uniref:Glycosyltransferase family 2 protein n=1 Tax=Aquincola agrisoli TaxID=3119538 RepID=A0AAW9QJG4_9BURK